MALKPPPGIIFVAQNLLKFSLMPTTVYLVNYFLQHVLDVHIPKWVVILFGASILPSASLVDAFWATFNDSRNAEALGAVMPPMVKSRWPAGLDLLRRLIKYKDTDYPSQVFEDWVSQYGHVYNWRVLSKDRFLTVEPEHVKSILAANFDDFARGSFWYETSKPLLGNGIFNIDGDPWRSHRAMMRPFFSKERTSHLDNFLRHADDAINRMKFRFREGYSVDIQDIISRFTLDSGTEFLFGSDVCSLSAGLPYPPSSGHAAWTPHSSDAFASSFRSALAQIALRFRQGAIWPLAEFWEDKVVINMDSISAFVEPIIEKSLEARKELKAQTNEEEDDDTLLGELIRLTDDKSVIKDQTINILVASRDTTAITLTSVIYAMSQHPETFERLRKEVLEKLGSFKKPTYDDLRNMKYLRALVNETLRLFPPVPVGIRESVKPTLWAPTSPSGKPFYVPPNTTCMYSTLLMHRRTDLWGPDAEEFDPDRFLDERMKKYLIPNPFIFLPFSAGPRICLGQQFAYNEMGVMLIRLAQSFSKITFCPDADPSSKPPSAWSNLGGRKSKEKVWFKAHLTLYMEHGCWVEMTEANDEDA